MVKYNVWMDMEKNLGMAPIVKEFDSEPDAQKFFDENYADSFWIIEKV